MPQTTRDTYSQPQTPLHDYIARKREIAPNSYPATTSPMFYLQRQQHKLRPQQPEPHPYLSGNFAPIQKQLPLTPCSYTGTIPSELIGGQYVRNGGNPVSNDDVRRDAHWFDGDGMLTGVYFRRIHKPGYNDDVQPEFVNQYIHTDVYLSALETRPRIPILPSISTLVNPLSSTLRILYCILRTMLLVMISYLPGSRYPIRKISVANTGILYHDGRALATCESGPPMRVMLPGLQTIGWFDGSRAEGESERGQQDEERFGGKGLLKFCREWTTAHVSNF